MSATYPYNVFPVFQDNAQKKTHYIGINSKDLKDHELYVLNDDSPFPDKPSRLWVPRRASQAYPHLAFILRDEIIPSCDLFNCLQVIVVDKSNHQAGGIGEHCFGLSRDHCLQWKLLEKKLRFAANGLLYFAKKNNGIQFVKSFKPFPDSCLPSAWRYDEDYPTRHKAVQVLHQSFAGYQWLMALISYGIILARTANDNPQHPRWAIYLQDDCKLDPLFVDAIKASPLNNFTRKRVGAFVLETSIDPSWASHIPYMEQGFCPIYIHWHGPNSWSGPFEKVMAKYRPTPKIASNPWSAVRPHSPCPSISSSCNTYDRPTSSLATTVDDNVVDIFHNDDDDYDEDWPSGGHSGQLPGESMDTFFARRKLGNSRRLALMTEQEHQSVIDRERNASIRGFSGGSGRVYVWLPNRISGWIKRVWVAAAVAQEAYSNYNKDTRQFDAVTNSWDCYSGWSPGFKPDSYDDSDDDSLDMQQIPSVTLAPPSVPSVGDTHASFSSTPPTSSPTDGDGDVEMGDTCSPQPSRPPSPSGYEPSDPMPDVTTLSYTAPSSTLPCHIPIVQSYREAFIDTLCFRYGFLCDDNSAGDEVEDGEIEESVDDMLYHSKCIFTAHHDELAPRYHHQFLAFATMLAAGRSNPQLWDLDPSSPRCLLPLPTSNENVFSIQCLRDMEGKIWGYRLMPPLQQEFAEQYFHLVVPQAAVAIECYRRSFISIPFTAQRLLDCGKSFRTLMSPTRNPIHTRPLFVLPHREQNFTFNHSHYVAYEQELGKFFQYPHTRAALLEGGILWRLAMQYLDPRDALDGPSDSACDFGGVVYLPDGTKLVDDCLVNNERDLICGTYIVYTGAFILCLYCLMLRLS
jgi:hypothetical protein